MENTTMSALTPGPGAYDAHRAKDAAQTRHVQPVGFTANFSSNTSRLHEDKAHVGKPG